MVILETKGGVDGRVTAMGEIAIQVFRLILVAALRTC